MNQKLLGLFVFLIISFNSFAQNNIQLNIHHKLGETDFAMKTRTQNNLKHDFEVTRLQYYISEIAIIHDGGNETKINDTWILVDAAKPMNIDLGNYSVNSIEKIVLNIGVEKASNHNDPASYKPPHALSPKSPSMHWGWNPGYRFVAIEGNGGSKLNQLFQLHGLGDKNYHETVIEIAVKADDNKIVINIDADYSRILENIKLNNGVIVHGDNLEAQKALENFRDYVFTASASATATNNLTAVSSFDLFPNPSYNNKSNIIINSVNNANFNIRISSILGNVLDQYNNILPNSNHEIVVNQPGVYFINLIENGQTVSIKKLIVH